MLFQHRLDAGEQLYKLLSIYKGEDLVLYALPRGGVVVAEPIAHGLQVPLELLFTRKIGHPYEPEYAIAAVSERGFLAAGPHLSEEVNPDWLDKQKHKEMQEIQRRKQLYMPQRKEPDIKDKTVILVDDGIATGLTLEAGILELKSRHPKQIIIAVPVAPREVAAKLETQVDRFIAVEIPLYYLGSVGAYYAHFPQVSDAEVIAILHRTGQPP